MGKDVFEVSMKSVEDFLDLKVQDIKLWERVLLTDSIFDFFPLAEIQYKDLTGLIAEHAFFVEGLVFKVKLGKKEDGYLEHNYVWSENQFNDTNPSDSVSGINSFVMLSEYYKKDEPKSQAWNDTVSNIVLDIVTKVYGMTEASKRFISATSGKDYWYQCNQDCSEIIQNLAESCQASNHANSPIYTFINCKGEFYFMSLEELFAQKPLDIEYRFEFGMDSTVSAEVVQEYSIQHGGMPVNKDNYKKRFFVGSNTASSPPADNKPSPSAAFPAARTTDAVNYCVKQDGKGKLLIKKSYQKENDFVYLGLYGSKDKESFQGKINSFYRDTALSYRMNITVPFNKEAVAGKVVKTKVKSSEEGKIVSGEFSGKWLIMESEHYIDPDGIAYSNLLLAKSMVDINSKHKFYDDFLG